MGKFDTHGGYFAPKGYFKVEEGGSHEENPNGGVQVGVDPNGVPNMLEEGEPVYNDYVYSDNITADKEILKRFNIPVKYAGKLYSKIADAFVDEAEERPLDPISNNGLNAMLVRLADAQETQKAQEQQRQLEEELDDMTPEELAELEAVLTEQEAAEQQISPEEAAMHEQAMMQGQVPVEGQGVPMSPEEQAMMAQQQPVMMACGGKMRKFAPGGMLTDPPVLIVPSRDVTTQRDNTATVFTGTSSGLSTRPLTSEEIDAARRQQDVDNTVMSFVPIVGAPYALMNASDEYDSGNYGAAALETAAAIPFVGPMLKGLKAGRKVVKAAKAYTKASDALAEAERAANKVSKLQAAGKDITAATKIADKAADEAIDLMVKSENARRRAQGISVATKAAEETAKKGAKSLKWGFWDGLGQFGGSPIFIGGLTATGGMVPLWLDNAKKRSEARQIESDPDLWSQASPETKYAAGGPMNKFATGSEMDLLYDPPYKVANTDQTILAGDGSVGQYFPAYGHLLRDNGIVASTPYRGKIVNGTPGRVPMKPIDSGMRWPAYMQGDVVWNAPVSGVDKTRIYPYYDTGAYVDTLPFTYGFSDEPAPVVSDESAPVVSEGPVYNPDEWVGPVLKDARPRVTVSKPTRVPTTLLQRSEENPYMSLLHNYARDIQNMNDLQNIDDLNALQGESMSRLADRVRDRVVVPAATTIPASGAGRVAQSDDDALSIWPRYAGIANAAGDLLWNISQPADRYDIPYYSPVLPNGRMHLVDPVFNPLDENRSVNDVLAGSSASASAILNSGMGPSTGATLLAGDYNAGRNIGNARTQIWDANNQRRNQVIAQRNANAQALGQFRWGIDNTRAQILNDARLRNLQNNLMEQRLNNAAEAEKWNAIRASKEAVAEGLAGMGRENFAMNQINSNRALYYFLKRNGESGYKGLMKALEDEYGNGKKSCGGTLLRKYKK